MKRTTEELKRLMTTAKKDMENTKDADAVGIESTALFGILRYVANECQKHPSDSVKDIVNEALDDYGLPFYAEWSDNDDQPISILPNDQSLPPADTTKNQK
jgi:hypothetical protein